MAHRPHGPILNRVCPAYCSHFKGDGVMRRPSLLLLVLLFSTSSSCDAQRKAGSAPFGLEWGAEAADIAGATPTNQRGWFNSESVPVPHTSFESYSLVISPSHGLCEIAAMGKTITGSHGVELRSEFEALKSALESKYGPPANSVDLLQSGSIWDEPEDYAMALRQQDRHLAAIWEEDGSVAGVTGIGLIAKGLSSSKTYVVLQYAGPNPECSRELAAVDDSAL